MFKTRCSITERSREDAGAAVSDQQMRSAFTPYPFDRYLVDSRKQIDMVNIIDDNIWNSEPALRPEDEIILRKLHEMLQSTTDDLKLLSGELSKYHDSGVQVKAMTMPLDEEFNEKIHIEEVVNAKFRGRKIVDNSKSSPKTLLKYVSQGTLPSLQNNNIQNPINRSSQNNLPVKKQPVTKNLQVSRTRTLQITGKSDNIKNETNLVKDKKIKRDVAKGTKSVPAVSYEEFSYKYIVPDIKKSPLKPLKIQEMPSINIRSDLKFQKVLHIDILPDSEDKDVLQSVQNNALVIEMKHEPMLKQSNINFDGSQYIPLPSSNKPILRKVSTMPAYESSESNNISSDSQYKLKKQQHTIVKTRETPRVKQIRVQTKKNTPIKKDSSPPKATSNDWKKKLNSVYGRKINSNILDKKTKLSLKKISKGPAADITIDNNNIHYQPKNSLTNSEYIPYSKLTLGGVNVSDIEKEISNIKNNKNIVISPILDKILSSRENSFHNDNANKSSQNKSGKIFTTSDENLLEEVLDLEVKVTNTLTNNKNKTTVQNDINCSIKDTDSYADDFTDEKSEASERDNQNISTESSPNSGNSFDKENDNSESISNNKVKSNEKNEDIINSTFTKIPNLSFKNTVDIFEYVHAVDTQDTGTQSYTTSKISPKETQTSPRDDRLNVQPIHNDLWPSIDPKREVQKMFTLEKEFLKKLIIDEYGDLFEKNLNKPSTSGIVASENFGTNAAASQKNTQTSPAHVKSVMTSPTRTKTRPTSPFVLQQTFNQQTSPILGASIDEEPKFNINNEDDLGISANLSSSRFSLRLPQTSREILSNLEIKLKKNQTKQNNLRQYSFNSSSSADADYSSSDLSSLGEINKKIKKLRKNRGSSISKISSSSTLSQYSYDLSSAVIPLRSEGEASIRQMKGKKINKQSRSEGELSSGQLR